MRIKIYYWGQNRTLTELLIFLTTTGWFRKKLLCESMLLEWTWKYNDDIENRISSFFMCILTNSQMKKYTVDIYVMFVDLIYADLICTYYFFSHCRLFNYKKKLSTEKTNTSLHFLPHDLWSLYLIKSFSYNKDFIYM